MTMIVSFLIPAAPYIKLKDGEQCSKPLQRIKSESTCKDAAEELGLAWGSTYRLVTSYSIPHIYEGLDIKEKSHRV